jgi:hypothetical protein
MIDRAMGLDVLKPVLAEVEHAKQVFHRELSHLAGHGGMTTAVYCRYLSFQYHLTNGVQRHFLAIAAHPSLSGRRKLRDFLYQFGLEEEPHYDIARHDLEALGETPLPCPLDVRLWWAYFDELIRTRPFVRLGATCVLENLGAGAGALGHRLLADAGFLTESNTRFMRIHFHEQLPHGDQIIAALGSVPLHEQEILDLVEGAKIGATLYIRMARWAMRFPELTNEFA